MENKKEEQKENRFTYSDNTGLKLLSEKEIIDSITKKSNQSYPKIKKDQKEEEKK